MIEGAIAKGRWTVDDKVQFQAMQRILTPEQSGALNKQFRQAFNEGKIELER